MSLEIHRCLGRATKPRPAARFSRREFFAASDEHDSSASARNENKATAAHSERFTTDGAVTAASIFRIARPDLSRARGLRLGAGRKAKAISMAEKLIAFRGKVIAFRSIDRLRPKFWSIERPFFVAVQRVCACSSLTQRQTVVPNDEPVIGASGNSEH